MRSLDEREAHDLLAAYARASIEYIETASPAIYSEGQQWQHQRATDYLHALRDVLLERLTSPTTEH